MMLFWLRMRFKETMMQIDRPRVVNTAAADEAELLSSSLFRGRFILWPELICFIIDSAQQRAVEQAEKMYRFDHFRLCFGKLFLYLDIVYCLYFAFPMA